MGKIEDFLTTSCITKLHFLGAGEAAGKPLCSPVLLFA